MKSLIAIALLFCISITFAFADEAGYTNVFGKKSSPFGVDGNRVRLADLWIPAKQCELTEDFACVISKVFVFSVPRNDKSKKTWTHAGASYNVISNRNGMFFGTLLDYRIIRQKWKHQIVDYAYSDEYGVISIKSGNADALMLDQKCGFVAITDTKGCEYKGNELPNTGK